MKTLQINNKHYQECDVVMLPTLKESRIERYEGSLYDEYLVLDRIPHKGRGNGVFKPQHFYILSNEEIKEGDWCIMLDSFENVFSNPQHYNNPKTQHLNKGLKKIIATTDSSLVMKTDIVGGFKTDLAFPQIPKSFIEHFISEYNKGNVITKVLVEYSERDYDFGYQSLIVNKNNEISILTEQETLTYSEAAKKEERIFNSTMIKKETLEEAALKHLLFPKELFFKMSKCSQNDYLLEEEFGLDNVTKYREILGFIEGAKWQAKQMLSREEVVELLKDLFDSASQPDDNFFRQYESIEDYIQQNLK